MNLPRTHGEDACIYSASELPDEKYPDRSYSCDECGQPAVRKITLHGNGSVNKPTVESYLCVKHAPAME
jgi:hypothetical protein